jgi:hypothetical protein
MLRKLSSYRPVAEKLFSEHEKFSSEAQECFYVCGLYLALRGISYRMASPLSSPMKLTPPLT